MAAQVTAWWFLAAALVTGLLHIHAEYARARQRVYILKPLTTALIIVFALLSGPAVSDPYKSLIVLGLCLSLAGDVFLMLPDDRFVAGLASFLAAHLAYIAAFVSIGGFRWDLVSLIVYAAYGAVMTALLWPHLGRLRVPVILYVCVILVMGWQALALWRSYPGTATLSAAVGASLFVVSDSALAYDRFRRPFVSSKALVLGTYYAAQAFLALSVAG